MKALITLPLLFLAAFSYAETAEHLVLVTADGIRWQEVFRGIDSRLVDDERYTPEPERLNREFSAETLELARKKLFPFLWNTVEKDGVLLGNRDNNSRMALANEWYFSYPGYNEILTGKADPAIASNDAKPNPNVTFLEWLHRKESFAGRVYAFGSWDVFPAIINEERSGIPVNAGFESSEGDGLSQREEWLNELQKQIPSPWYNVRLDAFTHQYALETLKHRQPKVLYVSYGETDDFAHDGAYHQYIQAANRFDQFVGELWQTIQSDPTYRNKTALIIATDHGRGEEPVEGWQHHGSVRAFKSYFSSPAMSQFKKGIVGAEHTWLAAMGPGIEAQGEIQNEVTWYNDQIAATALVLLGYDPNDFDPDSGEALHMILTGQ